jgi:iturin family lipopeptide synthetase C
MVQHRSVINLLYGLFQLYLLDESDRYLLKTAYSFDVSVTELFGWILSGGALVLLEKGGEKDPARIIDAIDRENITHINFVPTMFYAFSGSLQPRDLPKISRLRYIFLAGEELKGEAFDHYRNEETPFEFANLYGPTEATVYASGYDFNFMDLAEKIPIGKPLPNVKLFILDPWGCFQPVGVVGELCISGAGVARGYLNQPELTAEKFVLAHSSLFIADRKVMKRAARFPMRYQLSAISYIYKTGDLSHWLPDGNIEFLGRMDTQVKIRGFRIELEEIESLLLRYEPIKEAVVLRREKDNHGVLCAYIIAGESFEKPGAKDYLSSLLPVYMIPSYFILLEKFPVTASGKIDRNALPEPEVEISEQYVPPENEMEEKLCQIWSEILGIEKEKIGTMNNFFELGGNSVKMIMLVSRINNVFEIEVPISQIYNNPLIKDIAKSLISGNFTNQPVILLNRLKEKKIFCFPPQIGYGYSYMSLASLIPDYSFYGLTFIEDEDRLRQYVEIITELQPVGPYIFMGHSAAGRIAFQVTKTLEDQGYDVSDLIFCDCYFSGDAPDLFDGTHEEYMKNYYKYIDDFLETWNAVFLKDEVIEKTTNYMNYCNSVTHLEKVNANIHLIRSEQAREYAAQDWHWNPNCWNELTSKRYLIYQGWGKHAKMLDFGALEKNIEIIKKILNKIDYEHQV